MTDVMGAMKTAHGSQNAPVKNSPQIIKESARGKLPQGMSEDKFLQGALALTKKPNTRLVQIGNAVFILQQTQPGHVDFHSYFSNEPMKSLVTSYQGLAKLLKNKGVKSATTWGDGPAWVKMSKMIGMPVKVSQEMKHDMGQMKPMYRFDIEIS